MKRYLIHHDKDRGTWDLVVDRTGYIIEHTLNDQRRQLSVEEFEATEDSPLMANALTAAIARAMAI